MNNTSSLIWINHKNNESIISKEGNPSFEKDFNLANLCKIMSKEPNYNMCSSVLLKTLTNNKNELELRNTLLKTFIKNSKREELEKSILLLDILSKQVDDLYEDLKVKRIVTRIAKLRIYEQVLCIILDLLNDIPENEISDVISEKKNYFIKKYNEENIKTLKTDLDDMKKVIKKYKSIEIGINYDPNFQIKSAIVTKVNDFSYNEELFIDKMLKNSKEFKHTPISNKLKINKLQTTTRISREIYKDLENIIGKDIVSLEKKLDKYNKIDTTKILKYRDELLLYLAGINLNVFYINAGIKCSFGEETLNDMEIKNFNSIHMLYENAVRNDISIVENSLIINKNEKTVVITGPNNGGKTIMLQSLTVMQILYQNGLLLPCENAKMKIYSKIYSHFPQKEEISNGTGRLGEELQRLSEILSIIDENSLVLLNEPFITTSPEEGLEILKMTIEKFQQHKASVFIVTHYLSVVEHFRKSKNLLSLRMGIEKGENTYKISRDLPLIDSYAMRIAKDYNIDIYSLVENFEKRKAIKPLKNSVNIQNILNNEEEENNETTI